MIPSIYCALKKTKVPTTTEIFNFLLVLFFNVLPLHHIKLDGNITQVLTFLKCSFAVRFILRRDEGSANSHHWFTVLTSFFAPGARFTSSSKSCFTSLTNPSLILLMSPLHVRSPPVRPGPINPGPQSCSNPLTILSPALTVPGYLQQAVKAVGKAAPTSPLYSPLSTNMGPPDMIASKSK